ncbi:PAF acetylhydrolase family protein [Paraphaeosphaeria sporulosa]|uniref:1-alkyl-2-acetylglycerophosphocholine esterase n=1 Tax=Paraphaeosphaeria sporulosa TaxID=1460663 RepID=A0A177BVP6_9PLEO|nr:PAF acetylhydrolase family protein [Paraphaeosphaeria sporulosa]OAF98617.1 PAF acetylhydrolase family protein [Paraphaeosphaeria sporulosa]
MHMLKHLLTYAILALGVLWPCEALIIPQPNGTYTVALLTSTLVDSGRTDPYDPEHRERNITISLFYPIDRNECEQTCTVPYMPPVTSAYYDSLVASFGVTGDKIFESFRMQVCCIPSPKAAYHATDFPLVLFSAGLGGSRLIYNAMAQDLASTGYAVVTLDSTYDSVVVEYPDGTYVNGLNISFWCIEDPPGFCKPSANVPSLLETNVKDAQFVLETLGKYTPGKFPIAGAARGFNVERVAYGGHSFGGATAIRASMEDVRVAGSFNLDGAQFGNITDSYAAVLLFGRGDPSPHSRNDDATWQETWDHLKGWRREFGLRGAEHTGFGDMSLLAKLGGWPATGKLQQLIGTSDGQRSFEVVLTYVRAFLGYVFEKKDSELLNGPSEAYPEVVVDGGV